MIIESLQQYLLSKEDILQIRLINASVEGLLLEKVVRADLQSNTEINRLKELTKSNKDVYLIVNKKQVGIEVDLTTFLEDTESFRKYKQILIDLSEIEDSLESLEWYNFPIDIEYVFLFNDPELLLKSEKLLVTFSLFKKWKIETDTLSIIIPKSYNKNEESMFERKYPVEIKESQITKIMSYEKLIEFL